MFVGFGFARVHGWVAQTICGTRRVRRSPCSNGSPGSGSRRFDGRTTSARLHRPVGHARGRPTRRPDPDHARPRRPLPARGDRTAPQGRHEAGGAPRRRRRADRRRDAGGTGRVARGGRGLGSRPCPRTTRARRRWSSIRGRTLGGIRARAGRRHLLPRRRHRPCAGARRRSTPTSRSCPIGGYYTMDADEAAGLARAIGPQARRADALRFRRGLALGRATGSATPPSPVPVDVSCPRPVRSGRTPVRSDSRTRPEETT